MGGRRRSKRGPPRSLFGRERGPCRWRVSELEGKRGDGWRVLWLRVDPRRPKVKRRAWHRSLPLFAPRHQACPSPDHHLSLPRLRSSRARAWEDAPFRPMTSLSLPSSAQLYRRCRRGFLSGTDTPTPPAVGTGHDECFDTRPRVSAFARSAADDFAPAGPPRARGAGVSWDRGAPDLNAEVD